VDNSEINKNKIVHHPILSDVHYALKRMNELIRLKKRTFKKHPAWEKQIAEWKKNYPLNYRHFEDKILPQQVIEMLWKVSKGNCIVTTGVGQHQMWAGQFFNYDKPRTFLTSAGLGAMGFGYPTALGAKVACPNMEVVDIDGDGSFLMNIQELATAVAENIPAKVIILNNQHLGMVVQWEDRFFKSNRGHTFLGDPKNRNKIYPDYVTICKGFDVPAERISHPSELRPAIERLLKAKTPYLLDVTVPYTEHVLPMIPAGKTVRDIIIDPMELEG
jgi:acetolactate synthase-1/2/3 large subunit